MPRIIHKDNFIALRRDGESYLFFYDAEDAEVVIRTLARFAANPDLSFNWHDAAVLSRDVALTVGSQHLDSRDMSTPDLATESWPDVSTEHLPRF